MSVISAPVPTARPVVVTVDLHRGHLDERVATMPLPAEAAAQVVAANVEFLEAARREEIPVVHVVTLFRDLDEIHGNPFWSAIDGTRSTRGNMREHNFPGSPGLEVVAGAQKPGDYVVMTKKRYDCFYGTDLDFVLRNLGARTLLITGVNTNSCVLATTIAAHTRDYAAVVIEDCVHTIDGDVYHEKALDIIRRAFGWAMPWRQAINVMREQNSERVRSVAVGR